MTKSIKFKAKNIINIREEICKKKKDYWINIRNTNLLNTKEVKNGYRKYDLKALYNEIMQMSNKLVYIKGMLAALNTGATTFDKNAFEKTNNYNIFMATEIKEAIAQLKMVPTIDPVAKSKKGGAAKMGKSEVFTSAKIAQLIKDLNLKATKYNNNMEEFNTDTDIDVTTVADMIKDDLIA